MSAVAGSVITILVGVAAIIATWTGTYANYVKAGLRWPLIISGVVLIGAGTASMLIGRKRRSSAHQHGAQGIGALLVVFVAALALAPPPLGAAAAADRVPNRVAINGAPDPIAPGPSTVPARGDVAVASNTSTTIVTTTDPTVPEPDVEDALDEMQEAAVLDPGDRTPAPAEPGAQIYAMSLYDLVRYSYFAPEEVIGVPLQLVGFAAPEPNVPGSFRLTRYLMGCCAADAFPLQVTLRAPPFTPDDDQWVSAEAIWNGDVTDIDEFGVGVPVLDVLDLTLIDALPDPYES